MMMFEKIKEVIKTERMEKSEELYVNTIQNILIPAISNIKNVISTT